MAADEFDWEKRLAIATLKLELKQLTGQEILESMAVGADNHIAAPSNEKTIQLANGMVVSPRTASILRDPKPQWSEPKPKDYPTVEPHYIVCIDEVAANNSLPEARDRFSNPHKVGGFLLSDRRDVPAGWIKSPTRGNPIECIQKEFPGLYEVLKEKKVTNF